MYIGFDILVIMLRNTYSESVMLLVEITGILAITQCMNNILTRAVLLIECMHDNGCNLIVD